MLIADATDSSSIGMNEGDLASKLSALAKEMGADFTAVADASGFQDETYEGNKPQDFMGDCRSVLVIGVSVPKGSMEELPRGRAEYTNTLMAGTATLRLIAFRLARELEKEGHKATIVPTEGSEFGYWYADRKTLKADMSIKYAIFLAGMGKYGINHLILTKDFGPRVRMTAIVTTAPLKSGEPGGPLVEEKCASCLRCVAACPVGALHRDGEIDKQRCADYMFNSLGGLRCGLCVKVCPL